jgi:hypothetical protein
MQKEEEKYKPEEIREVRTRAATALIEYLKTFFPEKRGGDSKHSLMGPVGKLLSRVTITGDINWEAVKGYVLSVHKNQQARGISAEAAKRLDEAVESLKTLRGFLPPTKWLKMVEDLDDEVFFGVYKEKLVAQRLGIQKKFQEWLSTRFKTIDELNELITDDKDHYSSFTDVDDPFSVPSDLEDIVKEFWEHNKKKKKEK